MTKIIAYFDGSCAPTNPGGTAQYGCWIMVNSKRIWKKSGKYFPLKGKEAETSSNLAEYLGIINIFKYLIKNKLQDENIIIYGDSNLVIKQMKREWGVKSKNTIYYEAGKVALSYLPCFKNIYFKWIPREENEYADSLSTCATNVRERMPKPLKVDKKLQIVKSQDNQLSLV